MHEPYEDMALRYSAGLLSQSDRERFEQHLTECQICRDVLEEWQLIGAAARVAAQDRAVTLPPLNLEINKELAKMNSPSINVVPQRSLAVVFSVAALLALVFGVLIARPPDFNVSMIQPPQTTPTVYVEVVLAARPIERGSVISAEDVMLYGLPEEAAPFNAVVNLNDVVGKIARTSIPCGQPVLANMFTDNARDVFDDPDFVYGCEGLDLSPLTEPVLMRSIVMSVQELPRGIPVPDEAVILRSYPAQLIPGGAIRDTTEVIGYTTGAHILREQVVLRPMMGQVILPPGMNALSLPLENIHSDLSVFEPGMKIDIIVGMLVVPVDAFQSSDITENTVEPKRIMQRVVDNVEILTIVEQYGFMTVAVPPDETDLVIWIVEARLPLILAQVD